MLAPMPAEIHTLWRTAKACCEMVSSTSRPAQILLWVEATLVHRQIVASYAEAVKVAADLKIAFAC
jgi:hypothetical protein